MNENTSTTKRPRGFAAMHPDHVKKIASKGGKSAHQAKTAHEFTSEEARIAGAKGGRAAQARRASIKAATMSSKVAPAPAPKPIVEAPETAPLSDDSSDSVGPCGTVGCGHE